jgi:hypothetical protein
MIDAVISSFFAQSGLSLVVKWKSVNSGVLRASGEWRHVKVTNATNGE